MAYRILGLQLPDFNLILNVPVRGTWECTRYRDDEPSIEYTGWGGENVVSVFLNGTQAGDIEAVVVCTQADNPSSSHRVSHRLLDWKPGPFVAALTHCLEQAMQDPLDPIHPETRAFSRNKLETLDRFRDTLRGGANDQSQSTLWSVNV